MYGVANALHWKSSERKISTHLTVMRHQNTKTSLYKLTKNHWVCASCIFGSVRKRLQFTVFNDHPVSDMSHSQMLGKIESGGGPIFKVGLEC